MKNILKLLIILSLIFVTACGKKDEAKPKEDSKTPPQEQSAEDKLGYGKLEGHTYSNEYFGLTLQVKNDWIIQDKDNNEKLAEAGKQLISEKNPELKSIIDASELNTVYLLTAFQHEIGAPVEFNPSFTLIAEKISQAPGINEGKDYLYHTQRLLEETKIGYKFDKKVERKNLGGKDFDILNSSVKYLDIEINQSYYTAVMKGYALSVIMSYNSEDQKKALEETLNSLNFKTS